MEFSKVLKQCLIPIAVIVICTAVYLSQSPADPFVFFQPPVTITAEDRAQLDQGEAIAHVLKSSGNEVGMVAAIAVNADGDRLVEWVNQIEQWKKNPHVLAVGRFSNPPQVSDLDRLELDAHDVDDLRSCHPRHCDLKLSAAEMSQLQQAARREPGVVQQEFRRIIFDRVQMYLTNGQIPPNEDHHKPVQPESTFDSLLQDTPFLAQHLPRLAEDLEHGGAAADDPQYPSFFYWSKEHLARKAVVSVTQVTIVRSQAPQMPDALVVDKDIFSSHYLNGSLSMTALMRGEPGHPNYLVYVNRTNVDVLHGVFAGIIRSEIDKHLKDTTDVLVEFRRRLESGPPTDVAPQLPSLSRKTGQ